MVDVSENVKIYNWIWGNISYDARNRFSSIMDFDNYLNEKIYNKKIKIEVFTLSNIYKSPFKYLRKLILIKQL